MKWHVNGTLVFRATSTQKIIIMQSLTAKMCDLKERVQNSSEHKEIALLHTALFLGKEMLVDHALTFPISYQKYVSLLRRESYDALPLPGYKVLLYVGKEFGDHCRLRVHLKNW